MAKKNYSILKVIVTKHFLAEEERQVSIDRVRQKERVTRHKRMPTKCQDIRKKDRYGMEAERGNKRQKKL